MTLRERKVTDEEMMRACHGRAPGPLGPFTREEDEGVVRSIVEAGRMREREESVGRCGRG